MRVLTARQRSIVTEGIRRHLLVNPAEETRNRKRLRSNPLAPWELRLGNLRVFYDVLTEPDEVIAVLAVGVKVRNQVRIGSEDYRL